VQLGADRRRHHPLDATVVVERVESEEQRQLAADLN